MSEINSKIIVLIAIVAVSIGVYNKLQQNSEDILVVKKGLNELEERLDLIAFTYGF